MASINGSGRSIWSVLFCHIVYVVLGPYHEHIGLLTAMEDRHLFDRGNGSLLWLLWWWPQLKAEDPFHITQESISYSVSTWIAMTWTNPESTCADCFKTELTILIAKQLKPLKTTSELSDHRPALISITFLKWSMITWNGHHSTFLIRSLISAVSNE